MSWRDQCHRLKALWGKVDRDPRAWSDHVPGRGASGQCACVLGEACRGEPLLTVDALEKQAEVLPGPTGRPGASMTRATPAAEQWVHEKALAILGVRPGSSLP